MLPTNREIIRAALRADQTIDAAARQRILDAIDAASRSEFHPPAPGFRLIRRGEVARRLSCTPRTVDHLAQAGQLKRVMLPGRRRGAGFLEADVAALVGAAGGA